MLLALLLLPLDESERLELDEVLQYEAERLS